MKVLRRAVAALYAQMSRDQWGGDCVDRVEPVSFRVLGPVSAWRGRTEIDLGARKHLAVLAALLLRNGYAISAETVLAEVWGDSPPVDGPNVVSKYVGRLRRRLGAELVEHTAVGYRISTTAETLDLAAFQQHVDTARQHRADGDLPTASARLHEAINLCRETPLTGLDSPFFDTERDRLTELRLTAVEECVEVDLALDRYRDWIAELGELVTRYPLRERFAGHLMEVLHRAGRQSDALAVYRTLRTRLIEELGIEPDPSLASLHERILAGEAETPPVPATPRQLPPPPGDFTGREQELARLRSALRDTEDATPPVVVVTGPGGMGKTSLAVRAALDARDHFPDGQLYVEIGPDDQEPEVCARLLRALGVGGAAIPEPLERAALYRSLAARRRLLVVLDNVTGEDQVAGLIPTGHGSAMLLTSRRLLTGMPVAERLVLTTLPQAEARQLLVRITGEGRLAREPGVADELVATCGGLPLALRIAAARIAGNPHWTIARFVARLTDERRRLDELRYQDLEVRASVNLSYQVLGPRARRLLMNIGLLAVPDFASWTAAVLLDCDLDAAEDVLDESLAAHMIEVAGVSDGGFPRCRCHDLVRLFAREQAGHELPTADRDAVLDRALGAWLYLAERADAAMPHGYFSRPGGGTVHSALADDVVESLERDPLAWFDAEHLALEALIGQAIATGRTTAAWELAACLVAYYEFRSLNPEWGDTHRRVLDAARAAGDRLGTAVTLRGLGELYTAQDRIAESIDCFLQAREIFVELGEKHAVSVCDNGLGHMYRVSGQHEEALAALGRAADSAAGDGQTRTESYARHCSGVAYLEQGRLDEAEECFRSALALARTSGYRRGEAQSERGLGLLYTTKGQLDRAYRHLSLALRFAQELGEPSGEANARHLLGDVLLRQGRFAEARTALRQALRIYERIGEPFGRALALHTLGEGARRSGDPSGALELLKAADAIWIKLDAPLWRGRNLRALGDAHAAAGDQTSAHETWRDAVELLAGLDVPEAQAIAARLAADDGHA